MRKTLALVCMVLAACLLAATAAGGESVRVRGYVRSDGTYVEPYYRTAPDSTPANNYSYPGNYNPNTGRVTGSGNHGYGNGGDQLGGPRETLGNPYGSHGRGLLGD